MKTLIFGGSGQLGSQLLKFFPDAVYTYRNKAGFGGIKIDFLLLLKLKT